MRVQTEAAASRRERKLSSNKDADQDVDIGCEEVKPHEELKQLSGSSWSHCLPSQGVQGENRMCGNIYLQVCPCSRHLGLSR